MQGESIHITWVDAVFLAVFIKGLLTGKQKGLVAEIVNLLGIFFATFFSLHYYPYVATFLEDKVIMAANLRELLAFSIIALSITTLFTLVREGWVIILKAENETFVEQAGGAIISFVRSYFICGLIFLGFLMTGNNFVVNNTKNCLSSAVFKDASTGLYRASYAFLIKPFFANETDNQNVFLLTDNSEKNEK